MRAYAGDWWNYTELCEPEQFMSRFIYRNDYKSVLFNCALLHFYNKGGFLLKKKEEEREEKK